MRRVLPKIVEESPRIDGGQWIQWTFVVMISAFFHLDLRRYGQWSLINSSLVTTSLHTKADEMYVRRSIEKPVHALASESIVFEPDLG